MGRIYFFSIEARTESGVHAKPEAAIEGTCKDSSVQWGGLRWGKMRLLYWIGLVVLICIVLVIAARVIGGNEVYEYYLPGMESLYEAGTVGDPSASSSSQSSSETTSSISGRGRDEVRDGNRVGEADAMRSDYIPMLNTPQQLLITILVHDVAPQVKGMEYRKSDIERILREQFSSSSPNVGDPASSFDAVVYFHFRDLLSHGTLTENSLREALLTP